MVERHAAWLTANAHREVLGTEVPFKLPVEVDGERVLLTGTVDRLERLGDGRLHVVDFKTGKTAPEKSELPGHEQLGVYQLAAQQGAFDELAPGERRVGGAELVYLRLQDSGDQPYPKVFNQASLDDQPQLPGEDAGTHRTWVHDKIATAATIVRTERFDARVQSSCRYCAFADSCPAKSAEVVQ